MQNNIAERIRERAYAIWSDHGCIEGQADQHWLTAEREVLAALTATMPAAPSAAPAKKARSRATAPKTAAKRAAAR